MTPRISETEQTAQVLNEGRIVKTINPVNIKLNWILYRCAGQSNDQ